MLSNRIVDFCIRNKLLVYILITYSIGVPISLRSFELFGDEPRYLLYAENLLKGFYSPDYPNIFLWNGPLMPLLIVPFKLLGLNHFLIRMIFFLTYPIFIYVISEWIPWTNIRLKMLLVLFLLFYVPGYRYFPFIFTESLTLLLTSLIVIALIKNKRQYIVGLLFGALVLLKVVYSYVLITGFIIGFFRYLRGRYILKQSFTKALNNSWLILFAVAFLVNLPYLLYTYKLTNKTFYWANSGGSSIYWMSSTSSDEFGDWPSGHTNKVNYLVDSFINRHKPELELVGKLPKYLHDEKLKEIAIANIKSSPLQYLRNVLANVQRIFFDMPRGFGKHREFMLWLIPFNLPIFLLFVFVLIRVRNIFQEKTNYSLLVFLLIGYMALTSAVWADSRFLTPAIPWLIGAFWYLKHYIRFYLKKI